MKGFPGAQLGDYIDGASDANYVFLPFTE